MTSILKSNAYKDRHISFVLKDDQIPSFTCKRILYLQEYMQPVGDLVLPCNTFRMLVFLLFQAYMVDTMSRGFLARSRNLLFILSIVLNVYLVRLVFHPTSSKSTQLENPSQPQSYKYTQLENPSIVQNTEFRKYSLLLT